MHVCGPSHSQQTENDGVEPTQEHEGSTSLTNCEETLKEKEIEQKKGQTTSLIWKYFSYLKYYK